MLEGDAGDADDADDGGGSIVVLIEIGGSAASASPSFFLFLSYSCCPRAKHAAVKAEAALACSITFDAIFSLSPTTNRSFATEEERKRGKNIAVKKYNERPNNNWRKHTEGQIFKVFVRVFYFFPPFLRNLQIQLFAIRL